jgi:hypothetical protein
MAREPIELKHHASVLGFAISLDGSNTKSYCKEQMIMSPLRGQPQSVYRRRRRRTIEKYILLCFPPQKRARERKDLESAGRRHRCGG